MSQSSEQPAPELGTPTDTPVGDAALDAVGKPADADTDTDATIDTPDELGGTGGDQAGGAG